MADLATGPGSHNSAAGPGCRDFQYDIDCGGNDENDCCQIDTDSDGLIDLCNDDGNLNIADAIATLSALFSGGPLPPTPGPNNCDLDPTDDFLGCGNYSGC